MDIREDVSRNGFKIYKLFREDGYIAKLPSISTILNDTMNKPFLIQWAVNVGVDFLKEELLRIGIRDRKLDFKSEEISSVFVTAKKRHTQKAVAEANIGTKIHSLIENYVKHNIIPTQFESSVIRLGFESFLTWVKDYQFKPLLSEKTVYHPQLLFTSKFDCVGTIKDKKYLIDFKASPSFYSEMGLQLSGCLKSYESFYNEKLDGMGILRLDKVTGTSEWKDYTEELEINWEKLKCLINYYNLDKGVLRLCDLKI
jgi:hypothetical protein